MWIQFNNALMCNTLLVIMSVVQIYIDMWIQFHNALMCNTLLVIMSMVQIYIDMWIQFHNALMCNTLLVIMSVVQIYRHVNTVPQCIHVLNINNQIKSYHYKIHRFKTPLWLYFCDGIWLLGHEKGGNWCHQWLHAKSIGLNHAQRFWVILQIHWSR